MYDSIVSANSLNPLDELKFVDLQVDHVADLAGLKPLFARVDEIGRLHSGDLEVQLAVAEIKQRIVDRGKLLKPPPEAPRARINIPATAVPPAFQGPPAPPPPVEIRPAVEQYEPAAPIESDHSVPLPPSPEFAAPPPPVGRPARSSWKRSLTAGAVVGAILCIAIIGFLVNRARKQRLSAGVLIQVVTNPPGASVRLNGSPACTSNCNVSMPAGTYQVTAFLDGYEPAASNVTLQPGKPAALNLPLVPQQQSIRILTDLNQGKLAFDNQSPVDLQDGQFTLEKVAPGTHTVKVTSKTGEASFSVQVAPAKQPEIAGPVAARDLIAVLVSSLGSKARVVTNGGPWKLSLNGQPQADASPAGVDLNNFMPGVDEILVGEGREQRNMKESFGPAPMLTVFLKSDLNVGTLIISTGEDDAHVFLNGKEYPRKTQHGQMRIQTIGAVNVRVAKDGFEPVAPQTADVKKGSEVRLEFKMQALPQLSVLQIRGATPGSEVLVDDKSIGTVGDDGSLTSSAVKPGDHTLELRHDRFIPKRLQRTFRAGQTVTVAGADAVLAAAMGTVKLTRAPADAQVVYHRADEQQNHELRENQLELTPGVYVFTARATGFVDKSERVQVNAGETDPVELALAKAVAAAPPPPKVFGMADFEDPNAWSMQNGLWTHRGAGFIPFKAVPNGTFTFTVELLHGGNFLRGGRIRWALQYIDGRNYDLFELDKKYLYSKVIEAGKTYERDKHEHGLGDKEKSYTVQIEVAPGRLIHRLRNGDNWLVLDTWNEPGRDFTKGKFGFLVQGSDEIGLSDFKFTAK